jgi:PKD repeat protein
MKTRSILKSSILASILLLSLFTTANAAAPVANFYADHVWGNYPLTVTFYDASTNTPTSWSWDLDGDGSVDNTTQNPIFLYSDIGYYTVTLTSTNVDGSDSEAKTDYIYVGGEYVHPTPAPTLRAGLTADTKTGVSPLTVTFTDNSRGLGYFMNWDFGDGNVSYNASSPIVHVYDTQGKYTVKLTIYNSTLTNTQSSYNFIYVMGNITPIATTTYGVYATQIQEANYNVSVYAEVLPKAFTGMIDSDVALQIFWGIVFAFVFIALFMRVGDVPLLVLFGLVAAGTIFAFIPGEWQGIAQAFLVIGLAAIFYMLIKGRFR